MRITPSTQVPASSVEQGAEGTTIRELITAREGAPVFAMRLFEVSPGGFSPYHSHDWEHEVFILEGEGEIKGKDGPWPFAAGDAILVLPGEEHQFRNIGSGPLRFICCIPIQ
jgi:quercetin dioxygenase-like cupin family protein